MKTYIFNPDTCTEPFTAIIHGCAIMAAVARMRPHTMVADGSTPALTSFHAPMMEIRTDGGQTLVYAREDAQELFAAYRHWSHTEPRSIEEIHAWGKVLDEAAQLLEDAGMMEIVNDIAAI